MIGHVRFNVRHGGRDRMPFARSILRQQAGIDIGNTIIADTVSGLSHFIIDRSRHDDAGAYVYR